jgi:hypothetical protein
MIFLYMLKTSPNFHLNAVQVSVLFIRADIPASGPFFKYKRLLGKFKIRRSMTGLEPPGEAASVQTMQRRQQA